VIPLGNVADFEMGQAPPGTECNKDGEGTLFVKAGEFGDLYPIEREWTTKPLKHGKRGDVFICVVGATAGKLNLGTDCAIGRSVAAIRPRPTLETRYLYYQLQPWVLKLRAASAGSAQGVISKKQLAEVPVTVPAIDEQRRIVAEIEKQFSRLDEAVANLKRVKAKLKRYGAAVLKAAVEGRLVPTEAELARRDDRSYETGTQLLQRILETRRSQWKGKGKYKEPAAPDVTDLPDLPEGWVWASLDDIACDSGYGTSQKCSYENTGPAVLRIPNVQNGSLDLRDLKFAPSGFEVAPPDEIKVGDMLVIRTNGSKSLIGRAAVVLANPPRAISFASYLIRFRLVAVDTLSSWVSVVWQTGRMRSWIESRAATSAGQHNISMSVLATATVPIPPLAEQHRIVAEVDRRLSILGEVQAEVETNLTRGERLRHAVLSAAFIGSAIVEKHDR